MRPGSALPRAGASRGFHVVGVDHSAEFVRLAREAAAAEEAGRDGSRSSTCATSIAPGSSTRRICLCQGGFGLLGGRDEVAVFNRIAGTLRPGGRLAVSAFSAAFAVRHLEAGEEYDPATGVLHERATVRDPDGTEEEFDLWTTCFTARELELLAQSAGLTDIEVHGVTRSAYRRQPPTLDHHELLLLPRTPKTGARLSGKAAGYRSLWSRPDLARRGPLSRPPVSQVQVSGSIARSRVVGSGRDGGGDRHRPRGGQGRPPAAKLARTPKCVTARKPPPSPGR